MSRYRQQRQRYSTDVRSNLTVCRSKEPHPSHGSGLMVWYALSSEPSAPLWARLPLGHLDAECASQIDMPAGIAHPVPPEPALNHSNSPPPSGQSA
jgi:hypothetical protein